MFNGRTLIPLAVLFLVGFVDTAPAADLNQRKADTAWKAADNCAQDAFRKFPDYTPASNAKREAARQACLRDHRLPVAGGNSASAPSGSSDQ
jgi:hypothetical protein